MTKPKTALLVNIVAPSRVKVYERLAEAVDLVILHGDSEGNRASWKEVKVNGAAAKQVAGWQFSLNKRRQGKVVDQWFVHVEPGYITQLIRERPDAVISNEMGFRTLVALAYGTCFRKPVWVWWGGTRHSERHADVVRKLLRAIIAHWAKRWISYGQTSTDYLLSLGVGADCITQVQNCVDESRFGVSAKPAFDVRPQPVVLHVGQMIARKGITEFLRAAASLQQEGLVFSVVLVGGGPDTDKQKQLAAQLGLKNTHFFPSQMPGAMPGFYRSADVLIFPTMEDVWGLVANEAILCDLPVLCSQYAGCAPEIFDPANIFDPADEKHFRSALRRAVTGQLPRTDRSRLWSSTEVGDAIVNAVLAVCANQQMSGPTVKTPEKTWSLPGAQSGR